MGFTFNRSCQTGEMFGLSLTVLTVSSCKYFIFTILFHRPLSVSSFRHHLHRRLIFISRMFLIPNPPNFLLLLMISHLTRWYFFSTTLPEKGSPLLIKLISCGLWKEIHRHVVYERIGKAGVN